MKHYFTPTRSSSDEVKMINALIGVSKKAEKVNEAIQPSSSAASSIEQQHHTLKMKSTSSTATSESSLGPGAKDQSTNYMNNISGRSQQPAVTGCSTNWLEKRIPYESRNDSCTTFSERSTGQSKRSPKKQQEPYNENLVEKGIAASVDGKDSVSKLHSHRTPNSQVNNKIMNNGNAKQSPSSRSAARKDDIDAEEEASYNSCMSPIAALRDFFRIQTSVHDEEGEGNVAEVAGKLTSLDSGAAAKAKIDQKLKPISKSCQKETIDGKKSMVRFSVEKDTTKMVAPRRNVRVGSNVEISKLKSVMTKSLESGDTQSLFDASNKCIGLVRKDKEELEQRLLTLSRLNEKRSKQYSLLTEENNQLKKQINALLEFIDLREADIRASMSKMESDMSKILKSFSSEITFLQNSTRAQVKKSEMLSTELMKSKRENR